MNSGALAQPGADAVALAAVEGVERVEQALQSLKKAIAADDHNRIQARLEADLSALRGTQGFTELVAGGA